MNEKSFQDSQPILFLRLLPRGDGLGWEPYLAPRQRCRAGVPAFNRVRIRAYCRTP